MSRISPHPQTNPVTDDDVLIDDKNVNYSEDYSQKFPPLQNIIPNSQRKSSFILMVYPLDFSNSSCYIQHPWLLHHEDFLNCEVKNKEIIYGNAKSKRLTSLKHIANGFANISCFDISRNKIKVFDLNPTLADIMYLNLSRNLLLSIEGIEICQKLKVLDISDNLINSLTPLRHCKELKRLRAVGNRLWNIHISDGYEIIEYLDLSDNLIGSLEQLVNFRSLKILICQRCAISSILPLMHLPLVQLDLSCNKIGSLHEIEVVVASLHNLMKLDMRKNPVCKLSTYTISLLENSHQLKELDDTPLRDDIRQEIHAMKVEAHAEALIGGLRVIYQDQINRFKNLSRSLSKEDRNQKSVDILPSSQGPTSSSINLQSVESSKRVSRHIAMQALIQQGQLEHEMENITKFIRQKKKEAERFLPKLPQLPTTSSSNNSNSNSNSKKLSSPRLSPRNMRNIGLLEDTSPNRNIAATSTSTATVVPEMYRGEAERKPLYPAMVNATVKGVNFSKWKSAQNISTSALK